MTHKSSEMGTNPDSCKACGGRHFTLLSSVPDFDGSGEYFQLSRCEGCGLVRTEPQLDRAQLSKYYVSSYYGSGGEKFSFLVEGLTRFFSNRRVKRFQVYSDVGSIEAVARKKIIDIGCGRGNFLKAMMHKGWDCYGVERAGFTADGYPEGFNFYIADSLADLSLTSNSFDAAAMWHVLEHLEDPYSIIQEVARILKRGGILGIAVPNYGSLQSRFFGDKWFHLDVPRHRYHFTPDVLESWIRSTGLVVIKQHTFSVEQNPFGFIQSFLNQVSPFRMRNHLYSLLKKTKASSPLADYMFWSFLLWLILPFSLIEYLVSGLLGRGATLVLYARKM